MEHVEGRRDAGPGVVDFLVDEALSAAKGGGILRGGWFRESIDAELGSVVLQRWLVLARAKAAAYAEASHMVSDRRLGLMVASFHGWAAVVEHNVGILYVQHQLKAKMQHELLRLRGADLAASMHSRAVILGHAMQRWLEAVAGGVAASRLHWERCTSARAMAHWREAAQDGQPVRWSQARLSGLRARGCAGLHAADPGKAGPSPGTGWPQAFAGGRGTETPEAVA